ncbi:VOC family protein [Algicola sagamiensis]|uniref:VOC family protein n=1 Tax=Algicola sagamiensis TaxID=163869 RepID=UPI00039FACFE|nr:VOC family protein [Algicola sagamiensis]
MLKVDSLVLYVKDIDESYTFYSRVFEEEGRYLSPTFVAFPLDIPVALKQIDTASSKPDTSGGGTELSFKVNETSALMRIYEQWKSKGVSFLQEPTELCFGDTFVAIDPDFHRIRVSKLNIE